MSKESKNRLGRGLESLIPTDVDQFLHADTPKEVTQSGSEIIEVAVGDIEANPHQPRNDFERTALTELADSIRVHGVVQPLIVIRHGKNYQLVAGERRLRAAKLADLTKVPVIARSMKDQQQLEIALIENIQRSELTVLEQAAAYQKLREQFNLDLAGISKRVGKAPQTVNNIIRLLNLPKEAKDALNKGLITEGHARTLLTVSADPAQQQHMLSMIIKRGLTVRQAEEMARNFSKTRNIDEKKVTRGSEVERGIVSSLGKFFKTKVKIQKTAKGGKLVIPYSNDTELEKIAQRILD